MARGDVKVGIDYSGTEAGADQLDGLIDNLAKVTIAEREAATEAKKLEKANSDLARSAKKQADEQKKLQAALAAQITGWGALGGSIGQVGSVMSRIAPEFSKFGDALGSLGATIPVVATALAAPSPASLLNAAISVTTTLVDGAFALNDYVSSMGRANDSVASLAAETADATTEIDKLIGALRRQARQQGIAAGNTTDSALEAEINDIAEARERANAQVSLLDDQLAENRIRRSRATERNIAADSFAQRAASSSALQRLEETQANLQAQREDARRRFREGAERETELRIQQNRLVGTALAEDAAEEARISAENAADSALERASRRRAGAGRSSARAAARDAERAARREAAKRLRIEEELIRAQSDAFNRQQEERRTEFDRTARFEQNLIAATERFQLQSFQTQLAASEKAIAAEEELRADALAQRREDNAEIASTLSSITQSVLGAFEAAIEGQKSLDAALVEATKQLLKQFGFEMVTKGIGKILEGIAELPSPTAAPKIGGGAAMVAFGVGLGAAGAAIPSASSAGAEAPREDAPRGGEGGAKTLVLNVNNPQMVAATQAQLARGLRRQLDADKTLGPSLSRGRV